MEAKIMLSLVVCVLGGIIYGWCTPSPERWKELGRVSFAMGLLAFLLQFAKMVNLIPGG